MPALGHPFFALRDGRDRIRVVLTDETDWEGSASSSPTSYRILAPRKLGRLLD